MYVVKGERNNAETGYDSTRLRQTRREKSKCGFRGGGRNDCSQTINFNSILSSIIRKSYPRKRKCERMEERQKDHGLRMAGRPKYQRDDFIAL